MEFDDKEDLLEEMLAVAGRLPDSARYILKLLAHPNVIEHTRKYFEAFDTKHRCLRYEAPWSCQKESDARYENVKYGWTGSPATTEQFWCENCRTPILPEGIYEGSEEYLRDVVLSEEEIIQENKLALAILEGIIEGEENGYALKRPDDGVPATSSGLLPTNPLAR